MKLIGSLWGRTILRGGVDAETRHSSSFRQPLPRRPTRSCAPEGADRGWSGTPCLLTLRVDQSPTTIISPSPNGLARRASPMLVATRRFELHLSIERIERHSFAHRRFDAVCEQETRESLYPGQGVLWSSQTAHLCRSLGEEGYGAGPKTYILGHYPEITTRFCDERISGYG